MTKLNHSRYLDYYAKDVGDAAYRRVKQTPTAKQIRFYKKLYAMCKKMGSIPELVVTQKQGQNMPER